MTLKPERYEAREMGPFSLRNTDPVFGLYDCVQQRWVVGETFYDLDRAIAATERFNAAYKRAMEP